MTRPTVVPSEPAAAGPAAAPAATSAVIRALPSPAPERPDAEAEPAPPAADGPRDGSGQDTAPEGRGRGAAVAEPAPPAVTTPRDEHTGADVTDPSPPGRAEGGRQRGQRGAGLRERRRQETRARIVDAATDLFAERGFDAVSVQEIAQRAGVVEKTVFNHFPVKEGLVFEADPPMREVLLEAVRRRPAGESASAAAGDFVVSAVGLLGSPQAADGVARMAQVVRGSRTLQVREREILGSMTDALAELIARETGTGPGQVEPWLAAHAVLGLYASLLELARDRVLAGVRGPELAAELTVQGRRGLALLQFGLAGYAKRR